jgi:hypothetical protein
VSALATEITLTALAILALGRARSAAAAPA